VQASPSRFSRALLAALALPLAGCAGTAGSWSSTAQEASAPDAGGLYAKAFGGLTLLEDDELIYNDGASTATGDAEFDPGFAAGAALGYRFGGDDWWSGLAVEAEYTYRTNDVDRFGNGGTAIADSGDFASTAFMVNALYNFDTDWKFDPYVGVGFGSATEIDIDLAGPGITGEQSFSSSSPAAQYMVGAEGALTDNLNLFVEGRFFRAFDADVTGEGNPGDVEAEYGQFALLVGLSWML
jgi:opacity protein-like surface antigen